MSQSVIMPVTEVCDRWAIARLKLERIVCNHEKKAMLKAAVEHYAVGIPDSPEIQTLAEKLYKHHGEQWDVEQAIYEEAKLVPYDADKIAGYSIRVRELNEIRVALKNQISRLVDQQEHQDLRSNYGVPQQRNTVSGQST